MSDWVALPVPPVMGRVFSAPNEPAEGAGEYAEWDFVLGLVYNPVTNSLIAVSPMGGNRLIGSGPKSFQLVQK
jgi:hypothetical protein